jgi:hypothetical protein
MFSLTTALDGYGWLMPYCGHFTPGKEIAKDWNCAASCIFISLMVSGTENIKHWFFVIQHVHETLLNITGTCTTGKK